MKTLFIETKYKETIILPDEFINQLPRKLILAMPVQFLDSSPALIQQLQQSSRQVELFQGRHDKHPGQILGCDVMKIEKDFDAFVYIGDGLFHPTALLYENERPVYCYDPFGKTVQVLEKEYLEKLQKKRKGQLLKFYSSKKIGILVTSKPGQNNLRRAKLLKELIEKEGQEAYIFIGDLIQQQYLENFNFIDCWVNTGCPRIVEDFNVLNMMDVPLLKERLF